ncbi:MAG: A22B family peptidase, partial [archaeon]|nr:A22B family peptidase [archaeon]
FCCRPFYLYREYSDYDINMTLFLDNGEVFNPQSTKVFLTKYKQYDFSSLLSIYPIEGHDDINEIKIKNFCMQSKTEFKNLLTVEFSIQKGTSSKNYSFNFIQICQDKKTFDVYYKNKFIAFSFLSVFFIIEVFICSYLSAGDDCLTKKNFPTETVKETSTLNQIAFYKKRFIKWYYCVITLIIFFFLSFIIHKSKKIAVGIINFLLYFVFYFLLFMAISYLFKKILKLERIPFTIKSALKIEYYHLKLYRIISAVFCLLLIIFWFFNKSWVLSNIISISLTFGVVSSFFFQSFKSVALLVLFSLIFDIFWFIGGTSFLSYNYGVEALELINQPIKIVNHNKEIFSVSHPCLFVSGFDTIVITMLLKYAKCFDNLKAYNNKYYIKSFILFIIGTLMSNIFQCVIESPQLKIGIIFIIVTFGLIGYSMLEGEFSDFWDGENNIGMKRAVDEVIQSVEKIDEEHKDDEKESNYIKKESI